MRIPSSSQVGYSQGAQSGFGASDGCAGGVNGVIGLSGCGVLGTRSGAGAGVGDGAGFGFGGATGVVVGIYPPAFRA